MRIAILTFDGFNEASMNGVTTTTQGTLGSAEDADVVLFGSGTGGREVARDENRRSGIIADPDRQFIGAQCSGTLLMASVLSAVTPGRWLALRGW